MRALHAFFTTHVEFPSLKVTVVYDIYHLNLIDQYAQRDM